MATWFSFEGYIFQVQLTKYTLDKDFTHFSLSYLVLKSMYIMLIGNVNFLQLWDSSNYKPAITTSVLSNICQEPAMCQALFQVLRIEQWLRQNPTFTDLPICGESLGNQDLVCALGVIVTDTGAHTTGSIPQTCMSPFYNSLKCPELSLLLNFKWKL